MRFFLLLTGTILGLSAAIALSSYTVSPSLYQAETPVMNVREFFDGEVTAYGTVENWYGAVIGRFHTTLRGSWMQNQGIIKEESRWLDGGGAPETGRNITTEDTWHITSHKDHDFTLTSDHIEGVAIGTQYGNALHMHYTKQASLHGQSFLLSVSDWIHLIDRDHAVGSRVIRKYGVPVGRITFSLIKNTRSFKQPKRPQEDPLPLPHTSQTILQPDLLPDSLEE